MKKATLLLVLFCNVLIAQEFNVIYDVQDNLVKLNDVNYVSWNIENDIPGNPILGLKVSDIGITLQSENYVISKITPINFSGRYNIEYSNDNTKAFIRYPNINEHITFDDYFYLKVKLKKTPNPYCKCLKVNAVEYNLYNNSYNHPSTICIAVQNLNNNTYTYYNNVKNNICIELQNHKKYKITVALTTDFLVYNTFLFSYQSPPKNYFKCNIFTKLIKQTK